MQKKFRIFTMALALTVAAFSIAAFAACTEKETGEGVTVTVSRESIELEVGQSQKLIVSVDPADVADKTVEWKSSDEKVATVEDGLVTAVAAGEATITVTSNGKSDSCKVTVKGTGDSAGDTGDASSGGASSGDDSSGSDSSGGSSMA